MPNICTIYNNSAVQNIALSSCTDTDSQIR